MTPRAVVQSYELGELLGYSGGPIHLRVVLGPTWFSASTDSPPFYSGQIDYATAFATFTRDDLGPAASVILFDYGDPGSSIIDRIRVSVEGASTAVDDGQAPPTLALLPPYPNPFNPRTTVSLTLPEAGHALVAIFDARGMQVVRLVDETLSAGTHSVDWPGADSCGRAVPSGTYFCRLTTIWGVETQKLQLVR